ncbi:BREX-1 system adenine-specific DNA-methyltransferase PglX [Anaerotardibacter muris]|uniref:BREX-1 system adenine-specific DNA-methyltransferase PglX n=1 Tax=Anaerotardibacter muris TaxID=2941505 RepID=UPI00203F7E04|nr:BREX-1 system adenine-specific DNA-methyltransferase PglX [Anaerotardibacter muris]
MNDTAIKNFCIDARRELIEQVRLQLAEWCITEDADPKDQVLPTKSQPLTEEEVAQRAELIRELQRLDEEQLVEQAAFTWFNRMMAIRYMEVNDYLPFHCRVLSSADNSFDPQIIKEATSVDIDGIDRARVYQLIQAHDDEALFRYLFLAVCNELSTYMPQVFEHLGSYQELLLPKGLLRNGSVPCKMVEDIPEEDWHKGVEIVGWMYQFYNSERKDEVFASFKKGKKAQTNDIAPATQLFTPKWIVQYLVQNSLGRLWMQSHPSSSLAAEMEYFVPDDLGLDAEEAAKLQVSANESIQVSSPEEITVCDPACGSGHILVTAFDLLAKMYVESGYTRRDIPRLILEKNLSGLEIDARASQMAIFCLTMKGLEYDGRFLARGVQPKITLIESIPFTEEEIVTAPILQDAPKLIDTLTHLSECGSLFDPTEADLHTLKDCKAALSPTNIFAGSLSEKLDKAIDICETLAQKFDVVVANPPYMGSSNMDKWLASWTKKNYPDSKRDLCTCFIERGFTLTRTDGYSAMIAMQSWMFLGSFEGLRKKILDKRSIASMAHFGPRAFDAIGGEVVSTTASILQNSTADNKASYVRLVDYDSEKTKQEALKQAIQNPDCGWFYRRNADAFSAIPGFPIVYWASAAVRKAFEVGLSLQAIARPHVGLQTGDNERFLRFWWEVALSNSKYDCESLADSIDSRRQWFPYNKGGDYRKWYGNNEWLVNYRNNGSDIFSDENSSHHHVQPISPGHEFKPSVTWSKISSGNIAFRYKPFGHLFDIAGTSLFAGESELFYLQGACNSSVLLDIASMLSPTLNFEVGQIATYPIIEDKEQAPRIRTLVGDERNLSKDDYDSFETSWDFKRHPMV